MLNSKLKLSSSVLRKYEQGLGLFCFYDSKDKLFWNADYAIGSIVSSLDGTLTVAEVIDILLSSNEHLEVDLFKRKLLDTFEQLVKDGFLIVVD